MGPVLECSGKTIRATPEVHGEIAALLEYLAVRTELFGAVFPAGNPAACPALERVFRLDAAPRWMRECARERLRGRRQGRGPVVVR